MDQTKVLNYYANQKIKFGIIIRNTRITKGKCYQNSKVHRIRGKSKNDVKNFRTGKIREKWIELTNLTIIRIDKRKDHRNHDFEIKNKK